MLHVMHTPTPLFSKFKILTLDDMIDLELGKFMYKHVEKSLPLPLMDLFENNQQVHGYNTRGQLNPRIMEHKSECFDKSYLARGPSFWTSLSKKLKASTSIITFSQNLKALKLAKYGTL